MGLVSIFREKKTPCFKGMIQKFVPQSEIVAKFRMKWKPEFFRFPVYVMETRNFRNPVPEFRNVLEKFRFLFFKPEKFFAGKIMGSIL